MKVFISYRRDDTGGRAGRLFDVLAARYGSRDVFLDVTAVAPGTPFDERVDAAIRSSDVVLVVIGRHWMNGGGQASDRRIDRADDYVRHEVRAALAGDVQVVPVLVEGAALPIAEDLPEDLRPLVRRQAVTVRDESWHRDVDDLVRWLEGKPSTAGSSNGRRLHRTTVGAALVAGVVVAGAAIIAMTRFGGGDDGSSDELAQCGAPVPEATDLQVDGDTVEVVSEGDDIRVSPQGGRHRVVDGEYAVEIDVDVENAQTPRAGTQDDDTYVSDGYVRGLVVDGVKSDRITCASYIGVRELAPGQHVQATFGFLTEVDPSGVEIELVLNPEGEVRIGTG